MGIVCLAFLAATAYAGLAGGLHYENLSGLDSVEYDQILAFADKANSDYFGTAGQEPATGSYVASRIIKYAVQMVAGINHHIWYEISNGTLEGQKQCYAVVLEQSWTNTLDVSSVTCNEH